MQVWDGVSEARINFNSEHKNVFSLQKHNTEALAWIIENFNIQRALLSQIDENAGRKIEFLDQSKVEKIFTTEPNADNQSLSDVDLSDWPTVELNNGKILKARLLIGADGVESPVRSFANIESLGWNYNAHAVVATLNIDPLVQNGTAWQRFLPTGPIAMLPLPNGFSSMVWTTTPLLASKIASIPARDFVHLVNAAFRHSVADLNYLYSLITSSPVNENGPKEDIGDEVAWRESMMTKTYNEQSAEVRPQLPPTVVGVQEKSRAGFPLRMRNAESYVKERVVLVGDAAHSIHPLAGQGLNQGLGDARCLVKVLEGGIMNGQDIGDLDLLTDYSSKRYLSNLVMIGAVDKLHKLFSTDFGPVVWARWFGLQALNGLEPVKAEIMKVAMGVE